MFWPRPSRLSIIAYAIMLTLRYLRHPLIIRTDSAVLGYLRRLFLNRFSGLWILASPFNNSDRFSGPLIPVYAATNQLPKLLRNISFLRTISKVRPRVVKSSQKPIALFAKLRTPFETQIVLFAKLR